MCGTECEIPWGGLVKFVSNWVHDIVILSTLQKNLCAHRISQERFSSVGMQAWQTSLKRFSSKRLEIPKFKWWSWKKCVEVKNFQQNPGIASKLEWWLYVPRSRSWDTVDPQKDEKSLFCSVRTLWTRGNNEGWGNIAFSLSTRAISSSNQLCPSANRLSAFPFPTKEDLFTFVSLLT